MTLKKNRKPTRRKPFLAELEQFVPWKDLNAIIGPSDPHSKARKGKPPKPERMLRVHPPANATIINAPPQWNNREKKRDPKMRYAKKAQPEIFWNEEPCQG